MAAATTLPDDFSLECDLLQFVDDHDAFSSMEHSSSSSHAAAPSQSTANVDDLLGNSFIGLETIVDTGCDATASAATVNAATTECERVLNVTAGFGVTADDDFSDFLINGEDFLNEMEKVVKMDMDTNGSFLAMESSFTRTSSSSSSSSSSPRNGQDGDFLDVDALTDADVMSSPCPSSCPSSCPSNNNEFMNSPAPGGFDGDFLLMKNSEMWGVQSHDLHDLHDHHDLHQQTGSPTMMPMQADFGLEGLGFATSHMAAIDLTTEDETEAEEDIEADVEDAETFTDAELKNKNDAELLQKEAKYLEAQYDYLVSRAKSSRPQRTNIKAKRGRGGRETNEKDALAKGTQDGKILNELVSQQQVYLDNFKAMLAFAPVNDVRLALMTPMESYIHLGHDFDDRRRTILALREEKLDMTFKYIEQKSQGLNVDQPYQYSDMFEKFGKNYCVNFAISKYEDVGVLAVAGAIYEQIAGKDEALASAMGCLTIRESYDQIRCNFMHQRIVSSMKWNEE